MNDYSWSDPPSPTAFPIAKPGIPLILAAAFVTLVFALLDYALPAMLALIVSIWICYFFRDPDRVTPTAEKAVISPADGRIVVAGVDSGGDFYPGPCIKISVFMSVFNVHVNRIPYEGTVRELDYRPGKFFNASLDKASSDNERNAVFVETDEGHQICFVQIAGLIARRIISRLQPGQRVERGRRFGMICFGSRLDVFLPADTVLNVKVGERVTAGASILGYLP